MRKDLINIIATFYVLIYLVTCTSFNVAENEGKEDVALQISAQHIFVETIVQTGIDEIGVFNQVWRVENGIQSELLFELDSISDKPMNEVFSEQELAAFEEWYSFTGKDTYPPSTKIYPGIIPGQIILSPKGQQFAWIEAISWGPPDSTIAFAMVRLVVSDLGGGNKKILYETSRHPSGSFGLERNDLDGLTWSPDDQQIVFTEGMPGTYQAKIADVMTREINNLGVSGEAGIHLSWAPSGEAIATNSPDVLDTLNILSTRGEPTQKELVGSWNIIRGLDWSPNGKTFVFAGSKDDTSGNLKLYTLEVGTQKISQLLLDENLSYELPKWSPDGNLIAVNARPASSSIVDKLLIYDAERQEVAATLEGKRSSWDFYWSDDSQAILLTRGFPPDIPRTVQLFHWQENRTEVIPFPEGIEDGVAIGISGE